MKKNELAYKLSIALLCSVFGILTGGICTYLLAIYVFNQDLNQAIFMIVILALIGSQLGIVYGLKLGNKLYKRKTNML